MIMSVEKLADIYWDFDGSTLHMQQHGAIRNAFGGFRSFTGFCQDKITAVNSDGLVKSQNSDDFVKRPQARRANPEE